MPYKADYARTSVKTSDGAVKSAAGEVYWILATAEATGGLWQLNDSTDDSGADVLVGTQAANTSTFHGPFDPPIQCKLGIFVDIDGSNMTFTVGFD